MCGLAVFFYGVADWFMGNCHFYFSLGDIVLNDILKCNASVSTVALFDVCAITVFLCLATPVAFYKGSLDEQYNCFLEEFAQDGESPEFTQLFFRSYEYGLPILFTMSDGKVYIGYVTEIYATPFNDIHIIPIISGYRDKSNLKLMPVTPYRDIIHDVENSDVEVLDFEAFTVSLPLREIVYAHLHDFEKYEKFKEAEKNLNDYTQEASYTFDNKLAHFND